MNGYSFFPPSIEIVSILKETKALNLVRHYCKSACIAMYLPILPSTYIHRDSYFVIFFLNYLDSSDIGLNSNPEPPEEMWECVRSTE